MLVWSGKNTEARRAGCRESVELAERQVVPTHALTWDNISKLVAEQDGNLYRERKAREPETGSNVANQSRSNVSDRVMMVGIVVTVPNKFRLRSFDVPNRQNQSLTLRTKAKLRRDYFRHDPR